MISGSGWISGTCGKIRGRHPGQRQLPAVRRFRTVRASAANDAADATRRTKPIATCTVALSQEQTIGRTDRTVRDMNT